MALLLSWSACEEDPLALIEEKAIASYISKLGLSLEPVSRGLYVIEDTEGTGDLITNGQTVSFSLVGRMLTQTVGTTYRVFYRSADDAPIELKVGAGESLEAFDIALPYLKQGSVARLVVPSELAYGSSQVGNLPEQTPLLLEIEVLAVRN